MSEVAVKTQSDLIREVAAMGPKTPFAKLLKQEFGVDTTEGTPLYQTEYLYKYCLQGLVDGTPKDKIVENAREKVKALIQRFPHIEKKYDEVVNHDQPAEPKSRKRNFIEDNTVIHVVRNDRFYFWLGGVVTVSAKTIESLDKCLIRKYGSVPAYKLEVNNEPRKRKEK